MLVEDLEISYPELRFVSGNYFISLRTPRTSTAERFKSHRGVGEPKDRGELIYKISYSPDSEEKEKEEKIGRIRNDRIRREL